MYVCMYVYVYVRIDWSSRCFKPGVDRVHASRWNEILSVCMKFAFSHTGQTDGKEGGKEKEEREGSTRF